MTLTLQWLAGFINGEGCITYYNKGNGLYPKFTITNTYLPIMKAIQSQFGGSLNSYQPKYENSKCCWVLSWQCKKAIALLKELVPFLTVKKTQAELVIHAHENLKRDGQRLSAERIAQRVQLQSQLTELKHYDYVQ